VAKAGCQAIANLLTLSNDTHSVKLTSQGGCEAVILSLKTHVNNAKVAEKGCQAIALLAVNGTARAKLSSEGALQHTCEAILSALKAHVDCIEVAKQGCLALPVRCIG
jgi:hypothetical protein